MAAVQTMMDFGDPRRGRRVTTTVGRQHFRTTTLTVPRRQYDLVKALSEGSLGDVCVEYVNDIVSSCRGEQSDTIHHTIRRTDLLRNQWRGGYRKVNVRYTPGASVVCEMAGQPEGDSDGCAGRVLVRRMQIAS